MEHLSYQGYLALREGAEILAKDLFGDKTLLLRDGTSILKLYRVKHLISSARFYPYSLRFVHNAKRLLSLGIPTVKVINIYKVPSINRTAVLYEAIKGRSLPDYIAEETLSEEMAEKLAAFVATLHGRGVYFRAIHFSNIIVSPDLKFGLIDIDDMRFKKRPLNIGKRLRNLRHFLCYESDRELIKPYISTVIRSYTSLSNLQQRHQEKVRIQLYEQVNPQITLIT